MFGRGYYDEQEASCPATPPRPDDKRYPAPEDTGKAQADGYTVVARRPFGSGNQTGWMKPSDAEDYERMQAEYPGTDSSFYGY